MQLWRVKSCGVLGRERFSSQCRLRHLAPGLRSSAGPISGVKVAPIFVLFETTGQALIWLSPNAVMVLAGAALTGFGYALVYPGLGVEAVRRASPESRGLAMGAYTAFLDLALGIAGPALGLIVSGTGLTSVFLASTLVVLCSAAISLRLLRVHSERS